MSNADRAMAMYGTGGLFWKVTPGKHLIHLLPEYEKRDRLEAKREGAVLDELGILTMRIHGFLPMLNARQSDSRGDDEKTPTTSYRCNKDRDKRCVFCEFFDELASSADRADQQVGRRYQANPKSTMDIYLVKEGAVKRWEFAKLVFQALHKEREFNPNLCDPKRGPNIWVVREGTGQYDTKYTIRALNEPKALPSDLDMDKLPNILDVLHSRPFATPKEQKEILRIGFKARFD